MIANLFFDGQRMDLFPHAHPLLTNVAQPGDSMPPINTTSSLQEWIDAFARANKISMTSMSL